MQTFSKFMAAVVITFGLPVGQSNAATLVSLTVGSNGGAACGAGGQETRDYEITANSYGAAPGVPYIPTYEIPLTLNMGEGNCSARSRVYGMSGVLGLNGEISNGDERNRSVNQYASAELRATDIFVTPSAGFTYASLLGTYGPNIEVKANLNFAGDVYANNSGSSAYLTAYVALMGENNFGQNQADTDRIAIGSGLTPPTGAVPIAARQIVTNGILVDPNRPLSLLFQLRGGASARRNLDGIGDAQFRSYNSLSFGSDGPAFFVPDGFTVNAPSLGIFDNQWIDPRIAVIDQMPSAVPLPASSLLLLAGLGGLLSLRRRKV